GWVIALHFPPARRAARPSGGVIFWTASAKLLRNRRFRSNYLGHAHPEPARGRSGRCDRRVGDHMDVRLGTLIRSLIRVDIHKVLERIRPRGAPVISPEPSVAVEALEFILGLNPSEGHHMASLLRVVQVEEEVPRSSVPMIVLVHKLLDDLV